MTRARPLGRMSIPFSLRFGITYLCWVRAIPFPVGGIRELVVQDAV